MHGVIKNFRRGRHSVNERQLIIEAEGINSRAKAFSLVGYKVQWKNVSGKIFTGKITSAHGGKGALRALFQKGMPGQCLGQKVEIIAKEKQRKQKPKKKPKFGKQQQKKRAKPVKQQGKRKAQP